MTHSIYRDGRFDWLTRQLQWYREVRELLIQRLDDETDKICCALEGLPAEEIQTKLTALAEQRQSRYLDQRQHMTSGMTGIDEQKTQNTRIDRDLNACPRAGCQHRRRFDRNGPGQFVHSGETGSNAGGE